MEDVKKQTGVKRIVLITLVALLVVGGSVAAFVLTDKSTKETYFLAEKNTIDVLTEELEQRFEPELSWSEQVEENPTESVVELSAEYNDPMGESYGLFSPEQIINNSTITITTGTDKNEKLLTSKVEGSLGGFELGSIDLHVTSDDVMVGLPFLEETLQLKGDDFGSLLSQFDPYTFSGEETLDFNMVFEDNSILSEEDLDYLKEAYATYLYDELPESAFESANEDVKVESETVKTEKITLHLTEEEVRNILSDLFSKMAEDDRLKEMIKEQYQLQTFGAFTVPQASMLMDEANQIVEDFTTAMEEASEEVLEFSIPNGLTSTIWINDNLVVKRDFEVELGPNENEMVSFYLNGTHLFNNSNQSFDYEIGFKDAYDEGEFALSGELSFEDGDINDSISLTAEEMVLTYESTETLNDTERKFDRNISFDEGYGVVGTLIWSGSASYDNDQMNSQHELSIESPEISQDLFTLHVSKEAKTISSVEIPSSDQVKDLGSMDINELMMYFETEVTPQFEQWMYGIMGPGF
ncbi:hypothetical protein GMD78_00655 [Ornithinibacillus sp. L9]|uniref:Uncharacterized protein n=1 Tax=Ornithinibacillus caprae TaxID=2678566 RepID=A0A6N8FB85_9BACI|nr:DUF6583 family protein [Ornithinibacillus caprae]MUK86912.1 hypothetical protein [Ornithinibacillus caprae]